FSDDSHKAGVCARFTTAGNNTTTATYCLFIRQDAGATVGRLQISKKAASGSLTGLVSTTTATFPNVTIPPFVVGTWYRLTFRVTGARSATRVAPGTDVRLVRFGAEAPPAATPPLTSGGPGVVARQVPVSFDDVRVTSP